MSTVLTNRIYIQYSHILNEQRTISKMEVNLKLQGRHSKRNSYKFLIISLSLGACTVRTLYIVD